MKVILDTADYESISEIVRQQLRELMPDNEYAQSDQLVFGPEFMVKPLRISTPSTKFDFDPVHKEYIQEMRNQIKESSGTTEEQQQKNQQIDSIMLFGRLLFAQSASLHFLKKAFEEKPANPAIDARMEGLKELIQKEGIQYDSSRFDALSRRKEFNDKLNALKQDIASSELSNNEKERLSVNLSKAKDFYFQANDFNFEYANKPSRSFSNFINACERYGSRISLATSIIAIGASALSLIPCLAPVMVPIALAATAITMAIGLPIALKNVGTMLYNMIRFQAAPTPAELINTTLLGTSLLLAGVGGVVGQAVSSGALSANADLITKAVTAVNDLTKISAGTAGQYQLSTKEPTISFFKSEVSRLKTAKAENSPSRVQDEDVKEKEQKENDSSSIPGLSRS